ncbi:hypothetical protein KUTeg_015122 [Tegillarca granosa]|uniref:Uncharacterized protein n=1 Tax=Tegillarca granosa TaxID=220873 RepID=A0ABQ9EP78_TEGGR|nr:hypothetical protein KUTeg_015122 [Tegillarca granosa]
MSSLFCFDHSNSERMPYRFGVEDKPPLGVAVPVALQLQGSLMLAALFEVIIGASGLIGHILRFIGPITISVTLTLMGFSLYEVPLMYARSHWGVSLFGGGLMILFTVYLNNVRVKIPKILLTISITWIICGILTAVGQFGVPGFSVVAFVGFLIAVIASTLDSVGDYFALAKASRAPLPPSHAINRGIFLEGMMASRYVLILAGLVAAVISLLGKFSAIMSALPDPVLGGVVLVALGIIPGLGISVLKDVDLGSSRNITVIGLSLFLGIETLKQTRY